MKKAFAILGVLVVLAVGYLSLFPVGQRPDRSFDPSVAHPSYAKDHPVVLFDEAHNNAHTASGGFSAFTKLMRKDGYEILTNREPFTEKALEKAAVLVIVNASGGSNPKLFGINLVPLRKGKREAPAFTAGEIAAVRSWVARGGSLLLVADHYPFGPAAAGLASAFGATLNGGYVDVRDQFEGQEDSSTIEFSRANGLLQGNVFTNGRDASERVDRVRAFTGESLDLPNAIPILSLPATATESVPPPPDFKEQKAGAYLGAALAYERGRLVVMGEAAMLTAQIAGGRKFGMNVPGLQNRQLTLNLMHWLSRLT